MQHAARGPYVTRGFIFGRRAHNHFLEKWAHAILKLAAHPKSGTIIEDP
jgi:hypothetical protein